MKSTVLIPAMLVLFLGGTAVVNGQDRNEKKIERLERKIEKQKEKLRDLTGDEYRDFTVIAPEIDREEMARIREEAMEQARESREVAREAMEAQREAMREQREAFMDQKREMEKQMIIIRDKNLDKLKDLKDLECLEENEIEVLKDIDGKKFKYYYKTPNWQSYGGDLKVFSAPDVKVDIPQFKGGVYSFGFNDQNSLSIQKELAEETSAADFVYEVKEGAEGMALHINGSIESGKVKIVIKKPDGEVFNEYTLSPLANVNWNQNIHFEDDEAETLQGKWTVTVSADKAKGKYSVQINGR